MPAHLRVIHPETCRDCPAVATVVLYNAQNGRIAAFCYRHGAPALADFKKTAGET